eukprot:7511734-Pyramimonas_sp.AAC.1
MVDPRALKDLPRALSELTGQMTTCCQFKDKDGVSVEHYFETDWKQDDLIGAMPDYWIGYTEFLVSGEAASQDGRG